MRVQPAIHRSGWALLALLGLALGVPGCRKRDGADASGVHPERAKPRRVPFATQVAYGRPDTCPEDAVDPYGDGTPSPMDLRCSYTDGTGAMLTRVHGRVLLEGPPGSMGESPGRLEVVMHRAPRAPDGPLGAEVGHASTDPQGAFTVGVMLRPGEYVLVVPGPAGARPRAQLRITVGGEAGHRLDDVQLVIPRALPEAEDAEARP